MFSLRGVVLCVVFLVAVMGAGALETYPPVERADCPVNEMLPYFFEPRYADGEASMTYADRPSCCDLQEKVLSRAVMDRTGLNQLHMSFGQFSWSHDNALTDEDPTAAPIEESCMVNFRSFFVEGTSPRRHINQVSACTDASTIYGSDEGRLNALRLFQDGLLREGFEGFPPMDFPPEHPMSNPRGRCSHELYFVGDVRGNENVFLTAFHVLFLRNHNWLAYVAKLRNPDWDDEALFQKARALNIAILQQISFYEYGNALMGNDIWYPPYSGYKSDVKPSVFVEFSQGVFRFPHAQISNQVRFVDDFRQKESLDLSNFFFTPEWIAARGIEGFFRGMIVEPANKVGLFQAPGMKNIQLFARDCARSRDFGIVSYAEARQMLYGETITSFRDISTDRETLAVLESMYDSVDQVDFLVGGMAEDHVGNAPIGRLFQDIFAQQLINNRDGDEYWFENPDYQGLTEEEKTMVREAKLSDIILKNTNIDCVPENVFKTSPHSPLVCKEEFYDTTQGFY